MVAARVKSVEKMGRRRLAYTVRKFNDGFYVLLNVAAQGSLIAEIERRLRVSEQVIKFITVRMDEEEKRLAKIKAMRDTKVKRSAQPSAPAPIRRCDGRCRDRRREEASCCSACCGRTSRDALPRFSFPASHRICDDARRIAQRITIAALRFHSMPTSRVFRDSTAGLERRKAQRTEREISWLTKQQHAID